MERDVSQKYSNLYALQIDANWINMGPQNRWRMPDNTSKTETFNESGYL